MSSKFLLAVILMLGPKVYGCVNFQAGFIPNANPGAYPLDAQLWDNLMQNTTPTCSLDSGYLQPDGLYHLTCLQAGSTATFDGSHYAGIVQYSRPGGSFSFSVPPANDNKWAICEYGPCPTCFVPTS